MHGHSDINCFRCTSFFTFILPLFLQLQNYVGAINFFCLLKCINSFFLRWKWTTSLNKLIMFLFNYINSLYKIYIYIYLYLLIPLVFVIFFYIYKFLKRYYIISHHSKLTKTSTWIVPMRYVKALVERFYYCFILVVSFCTFS